LSTRASGGAGGASRAPASRRRVPAPGAWDPSAGGWLSAARRVPSPNADERPAGVAVDLLVIHHISLPPGRFSGDAVERLFTNRLARERDPALASLAALRVSAHLFVRRRGELLQFVDCDRRAWHAGVSQFEGRERCNDFSIGIELEGDGTHPFTAAQYRVLARVTGWLRARYPLRAVAGHSDVAPGRKVDPGPCFDWDRYLASIENSRLARPFPADSRASA
jgi:AmpD protein